MSNILTSQQDFTAVVGCINLVDVEDVGTIHLEVVSGKGKHVVGAVVAVNNVHCGVSQHHLLRGQVSTCYSTCSIYNLCSINHI